MINIFHQFKTKLISLINSKLNEENDLLKKEIIALQQEKEGIHTQLDQSITHLAKEMFQEQEKVTKLEQKLIELQIRLEEKTKENEELKKTK